MSGALPQPLTIRNRCNASNIDPSSAPVIAESIAAYREIWGDRLSEVRLLGSIARGEAVPGIADIDFIGLLIDEPSKEEIQRLKAAESRLTRRHGVVSRVELDVERLEDVTPFRRFVLSSDSLSIHGVDHFPAKTQDILPGDLIDLVTPPPGEMISMYRQGVAALGDDRNQPAPAFWSRLIGKDLLKCLRAEALRRGGEYEPGIAALHRQVVELVPEHRNLADTLIELYLRPATAPEELRRALDRVDAAFRTIGAGQANDPPSDRARDRT
jgi:hypothetical protein